MRSAKAANSVIQSKTRVFLMMLGAFSQAGADTPSRPCFPLDKFSLGQGENLLPPINEPRGQWLRDFITDVNLLADPNRFVGLADLDLLIDQLEITFSDFYPIVLRRWLEVTRAIFISTLRDERSLVEWSRIREMLQSPARCGMMAKLLHLALIINYATDTPIEGEELSLIAMAGDVPLAFSSDWLSFHSSYLPKCCDISGAEFGGWDCDGTRYFLRRLNHPETRENFTLAELMAYQRTIFKAANDLCYLQLPANKEGYGHIDLSTDVTCEIEDADGNLETFEAFLAFTDESYILRRRSQWFTAHDDPLTAEDVAKYWTSDVGGVWLIKRPRERPAEFTGESSSTSSSICLSYFNHATKKMEISENVSPEFREVVDETDKIINGEESRWKEGLTKLGEKIALARRSSDPAHGIQYDMLGIWIDACLWAGLARNGRTLWKRYLQSFTDNIDVRIFGALNFMNTFLKKLDLALVDLHEIFLMSYRIRTQNSFSTNWSRLHNRILNRCHKTIILKQNSLICEGHTLPYLALPADSASKTSLQISRLVDKKMPHIQAAGQYFYATIKRDDFSQRISLTDGLSCKIIGPTGETDTFEVVAAVSSSDMIYRKADSWFTSEDTKISPEELADDFERSVDGFWLKRVSDEKLADHFEPSV